MEFDGDLMELLNYQVPQLGSIDELINNIEATDHDINGVLELGFEKADTANPNKNEGIQEARNGVIVSGVGLDAAIPIPIPADVGVNNRDNLRNDAVLAPRKMRKKAEAWTEQEHRQFLKALKDGLMGQWNKISRLYIPSRTPEQITTHAQKFSLRKKNRNKKRKSINDIVDDADNDIRDVNTVANNSKDKRSNDGLSSPYQVYDPSSSMSTVNTVVNSEEKWSNEGLSLPRYNQVHDPSPSMSTVNMTPLMPPATLMPPPAVTLMPPSAATLMPTNMPLPPAYDANFLYYVNQIHLLEKEKNKVMMMLNYCRQYDMNMASPMINGPIGLFPGAGSYYDGSYGVGVLEPYSYVGSSSSSFAANATTTHHDDVHAYYNNGHLQWVKPKPLCPLQYDQQMFGHDHVVLP